MNVDLACESFEYDNTDKWFRMILKCTELPSVNNCHGINTVTKVVFDQPWLTKFKNELRDQLIFADPRKHCPWITGEDTYFLAIKYIIKQYMWSRDLDNMNKYTQDQIAEACRINDSHITELHIWKNFRANSDYEYMLIQFGVSKYNYLQFNN